MRGKRKRTSDKNGLYSPDRRHCRGACRGIGFASANNSSRLAIITTALAISDARLYEAAEALRASPRRTFWTVTFPGARYGLISAVFVVFTLVITDFGVPKPVLIRRLLRVTPGPAIRVDSPCI